MNLTRFLFGPYPNFLQIYDKVFLIASALILLAAVGIVLYNRQAKANPIFKNLLEKFRNLLVTVALLGLLWSAVRYEGASVLSWRLWSLLILLVGLVWLSHLLLFYFRRYRSDLLSYERKIQKEKYLR